MSEEEMRILIMEALRQARDDALEIAIDMCEELTRLGKAEYCAQALRTLKEAVAHPTSADLN